MTNTDAVTRVVERVITPQQAIDGAGVRLLRSIAGASLDYLDPFLLFDQFSSDDPDEDIPGFPMHPHRGIETVSYLVEGEIRHRDTLGNAGTIEPGDVQWMTAGRAIMHEEMLGHRAGRLLGFQLWVNLPARDKMMAPRYQDIRAEDVPTVVRDDGVRVRVIAATVGDSIGPVTGIVAEPTYLDVAMPARTTFVQAVARGHTAFAYLFEGIGHVGLDSSVPVMAPRLAIFGDGDRVEVTSGGSGARFLLISGAPIGEPIVRYGPFVMNTWEEIQQTLRELRDGTFIKA